MSVFLHLFPSFLSFLFLLPLVLFPSCCIFKLRRHARCLIPAMARRTTQRSFSLLLRPLGLLLLLSLTLVSPCCALNVGQSVPDEPETEACGPARDYIPRGSPRFGELVTLVRRSGGPKRERGSGGDRVPCAKQARERGKKGVKEQTAPPKAPMPPSSIVGALWQGNEGGQASDEERRRRRRREGEKESEQGRHCRMVRSPAFCSRSPLFRLCCALLLLTGQPLFDASAPVWADVSHQLHEGREREREKKGVRQRRAASAPAVGLLCLPVSRWRCSPCCTSERCSIHPVQPAAPQVLARYGGPGFLSTAAALHTANTCIRPTLAYGQRHRHLHK